MDSSDIVNCNNISNNFNDIKNHKESQNAGDTQKAGSAQNVGDIQDATNTRISKEMSLHSGNIRVDLLGSRVYFKNHALDCTAVEFRLLCIFLQNKNRIVTRQMIFDTMWDGQGDFVDDNTLSVYIRRLREKIEEDPSHPKYLKTARGMGYLWEEDAHEHTER